MITTGEGRLGVIEVDAALYRDDGAAAARCFAALALLGFATCAAVSGQEAYSLGLYPEHCMTVLFGLAPGFVAIEPGAPLPYYEPLRAGAERPRTCWSAPSFVRRPL